MCIRTPVYIAHGKIAVSADADKSATFLAVFRHSSYLVFQVDMVLLMPACSSTLFTFITPSYYLSSRDEASTIYWDDILDVCVTKFFVAVLRLKNSLIIASDCQHVVFMS